MTKHPTQIGNKDNLVLKQADKGFTYLMLLFGIALQGVSLAGAGALWSAQARHNKNLELDFIGEQYIGAIDSYYNSTPGEVKKYPQNLEDLVLDTRYLFTKRHLRKIYADPFTKQTEWGLIRSTEGGIQGVYSLHLGKKKLFLHQSTLDYS